MSDALAAGLAADGFAPGDRLAVFLQNVPQFPIAVLATWKAGGIVVPVNPMNKERELTYAIEDSGATVIVTLESLYADVVSKVDIPILRARHHDERARPADRRPAAQRVRRLRPQPSGRRRSTSSRSSPPTTARRRPPWRSGPRTWRS